MNVGVGLLEGERGWGLLGYAGVGFATGYFGARGGFGLAGSQKTAKGLRIAGRLSTQIITTASRSIGNNLAAGRDPFGSFLVGLGPVNLRLGKNQTWRNILNIKDNWFNAVSNGIGMFTHISSVIDSRFADGDLDWDWNSLSVNYKNEILEDLISPFAPAMGPYSIWNSADEILYSEGIHVWQSRIFSEIFLSTYFWSSLVAILRGEHYYDDNFFEGQAHGYNYFKNPW
ncbi:MAG: hypothetical protein GWN56_06330 [Nitrosopumilaceae archaeon]|nr:hypothetical protein [Nitrosopumilaceae archaeon]